MMANEEDEANEEKLMANEEEAEVMENEGEHRLYSIGHYEINIVYQFVTTEIIH